MADRVLRCAVYTRKSTEDGLEQEFNSLDAQYEACAAYAASQRHEGWVLSAERYDDGGFSGGNMQRPGLKRLLADVESGLVDIILLYKIDRLTRSLADFAKIVEVLDRKGASFVSITQSFNTTTSMGRLTLNMLLSFAQFEREVTGERIRDKIAASKRKGLWMGGPVPLGYRVRKRKLVVVEEEAEQVRHIMRRYLWLGTVPALVDELEREGYRTKVQKRASGPHRGGARYQRGTLYNLLSNRIYRGMIVHKGEAFPGEHPAIVDAELFHAVQKRLAANACGASRRINAESPSLLAGLVEDGEGRAMTPSHSGKGGRTRRYRYYVTRPDLVDGSPAWRVPAGDLEDIVSAALAARLADPAFVLDLVAADIEADDLRPALAAADLAGATLRSGTLADRVALLMRLVARVTVREEEVSIGLDRQGMAARLAVSLRDDAKPLVLTVPATRVRRGHQLRLVVPGPERTEANPPRHDPKLIGLLAEAVKARELVLGCPGRSLSSIAAAEGRCRTRLTKLVALSCLAPDIVRLVVEGRHPACLTAKTLARIELPLSWSEQRRVLLEGRTRAGNQQR